jgi:hypothetical protein
MSDGPGGCPKKPHAHTKLTVMTVIEQELSVAQRLIYGRKRIVDALYQDCPDKFKDLQPTDIQSISLENDLICCDLGECLLYVERSKVISNFWQHRTRTPSYFDYKIWRNGLVSGNWKGTPIAALDYNASPVRATLEPHLGRPPRIATDKEGVQKLYFVHEEDQTCSCHSWSQLDENKEELKVEFERFSDIQFKPVCKHMQWAAANINLHALSFAARKTNEGYNPRICVYRFDHLRGLLFYRLTYDGIKADAKWLPEEKWKERQVYDSRGIATGECWDLFVTALSQDPPFRLTAFSQTVATIFSGSRSR